jgi:hypothetical protein
MSFKRYNDRTLVYGCQHYSHDRLASTDLLSQTLTQDLEKNNVSWDEFANKNVILDFTCEGQDDVLIQPLIDYLLTIKPIETIRVYFSAVVDVDRLPYRAVCHPFYMIDHGKFYSCIEHFAVDSPLEKKFICLSRRPSNQRAKFLGALLNRVDNDQIRWSFGSQTSRSLSQYQEYFGNQVLPQLIDGVVDEVKQHEQTSVIFRNCLFNIVIESSDLVDPWAWKSRFITEKTFKAFAWRQLPIWFAVPGTVDAVRRLGFDVFDNLLDWHNYDNEQDQDCRIEKILSTIENLDKKYSLTDCKKLKQELVERINSNSLRMKKLVHEHQWRHEKLLEKLAED